MPSSTDELSAARPATRRPRGASGPGAADLAAIAAGGGLGSVARYLLSQAFPAGHGFPWAIFAVNVSGCFLLGLLMIYLLEVWPPRRYLRPFLAVGLIGGYTTFSTYAAAVMTLLTSHAPRSRSPMRCPASWSRCQRSGPASRWPARRRPGRAGPGESEAADDAERARAADHDLHRRVGPP